MEVEHKNCVFLNRSAHAAVYVVVGFRFLEWWFMGTCQRMWFWEFSI